MVSNVVIFGGSGYIGSHIVEAFVARGIRVIVLDRFSNTSVENPWYGSHSKQVIPTVCDITRPHTFPAKLPKIDLVIHAAGINAAGPSFENPALYYSTHVTGTLNAIQWSRKMGIKRFLYIASSSCYDTSPNLPVTEDAPINPSSPYALTKYMGEEIVLHWAQVYKFSVASMRLTAVFGGRSAVRADGNSWIWRCLDAYCKKKKLIIYGNGKQTRDFIHIDDVVSATSMLYDYILGQEQMASVFNIGSGREVRLQTVADMVGCEYEISRQDPGMPLNHCVSTEKIQRTLGWKPKISVEKGIELVKNEYGIKHDGY
jgi:UDP-glucose 4-epimerase